MLIRNATLVELDPPGLETADLRTEGWVITERGTGLSPAPGEETLDAGGAWLLPGLVCSHTHLYGALARGMPQPPERPTSFHEILRRVWWRLDRALDLEGVEVSALLGGVEAALSGTTTIVDHHSSPSVIRNSLKSVKKGLEVAGVRGVLCYEVTDRNGPEGAREGIAETRRFLEKGRSSQTLKRRPGLFAGTVGAHASFTLEDSTLDDLAELARETRAPLHIHLAEDPCDDAISREKYGSGAVERLESRGLLGPGSLVAHGVHLDEATASRLAGAGVWFLHQPRSNMLNSVGYAPVAAFGDRVALGTDGVSHDMLAEAHAAFHKALDAGAGLGPSDVVAMLARGHRMAADLLGVPNLGRLQSGAPADLVVASYIPPTPVTEENIAAHILFGLDRSHVEHVMVAGQWIVKEGRHLACPREELADRASEAAARLWKRMEQL